MCMISPSLAGFQDASSWKIFNTTSLNITSRDMIGGIYHRGFVYSMSSRNCDGGCLAVRYNISKNFTSNGAWEFANMSNITSSFGSYFGLAAYNDYIYFIAGWRAGVANSNMFRFNTSLPFNDPSSWSNMTLATINPVAKGFSGGIVIGHYLFIMSNYNGSSFSGLVVRFDLDKEINDTNSYMLFNTETINASWKGFAGGITDSHYLYIQPSSMNVILRYDSQGNFTDPASWSGMPLISINLTLNTATYDGTNNAFDGRNIYMSPYTKGSQSSGLAVKYDTQASFTDAGSYSVFDMTTIFENLKGYEGTTYSNGFVYYASNGYVGNASGSGYVTRYNISKNFNNSDAWEYVDTKGFDSIAGGYGGAIADNESKVYFVQDYTLGTGIIAQFDGSTPTALPPVVENLTVSIQQPTGALSSSNVSIDYTITNGTPSLCQYEMDGAANITLALCGNTTRIISDGLHKISIFANNSLGTFFYGQSNFSVNTSVPVIHNITVSIQSPAGSYSTNTTYNTSISYTVLGAMDKCWYDLNGTNIFITSCRNTTRMVDIGSYVIKVYANTTSGEIGSASSVFSITLINAVTGKVTGVPATIAGIIAFLFTIFIITMVAAKLINNEGISIDSMIEIAAIAIIGVGFAVAVAVLVAGVL